MTSLEIEQAIFDLEEVRIVIRAPAAANLGNFQYARKAAGNASVTEWLQQRVVPILATHTVVIIDGSGRVPHGRTKMENLRASYT